MNTISRILKSMIVLTVTGAILLLASGCATSFTGSAYVENGRSGCQAKCKGDGLEFVGMVYMGEYSDACVCGNPNRATSSNLSDGVASVTAGAAGVVMQMQRQAQQNARH